MTYSSAVFQSETDTLEDAQNRKYQKLAELADIQPGERVLKLAVAGVVLQNTQQKNVVRMHRRHYHKQRTI